MTLWRLWAGPEFVPMNGICRNFPQSIVELLRGTGTAGDNRLCTTLFCISSALKKLSQTTPLPETRSADAPAGRHVSRGKRSPNHATY